MCCRGHVGQKFEALRHLPKLTHLSIGCSFTLDLIRQLLCHCQRLRLLIIIEYSHIYMHSEKLAPEDLSEINDNQLVVVENRPYQNSIHGWVKGGDDGIDY